MLLPTYTIPCYNVPCTPSAPYPFIITFVFAATSKRCVHIFFLNILFRFVIDNNMTLLYIFFQPTVTSISCSPCGKSVGTPIRVWCTICGSGNAARSSRGDPKPWPRLYYPCSKRAYPYPKPPENTTYLIQRSCCTPTVCTTCSVHLPTVAQVKIFRFIILY